MAIWVSIHEVRVVGHTAYEVVVTAKAKHVDRPAAMYEAGASENGGKWVKVYIPRRHVKLETLPAAGGIGSVQVRREWVEHTDLEWS